MANFSKIVLAYSGGLDTSVILCWLREQYNCEVVTFTANLGQKEDFALIENKAKQMQVKQIYIENLQEEFVKDYVFPMFRVNPLYEGCYLLGTSIARPLIAKRQVEIAHEVGAEAVSHGATGKGNDQVRFELGYVSTDPSIAIIAPWREWDLNSRTVLIQYAKKHNIEITMGKEQESPFSIDENILHTSYEGKFLEDPWQSPELDNPIFSRTLSLEKASDSPEYIELEFVSGDPIAINGKELSPAQLLSTLNEYGGRNAIGRVDLVENRYVGIKSRGIYETPGGTILLHARRALESIVLDRNVAHLKDENDA